MYYVQVLQKELESTKAYILTSSTETDTVKQHVIQCEKLKTTVDILKQNQLPTMYWIPKLHKNPYKSRFIANSSSCSTTNLSKLLTSCLTEIKNHVIRYCEKVYANSGINLFWSIKNSSDILNKLLKQNFHVSTVSTYDFSTLYTTLPHNLIKDKITKLIQKTFAREKTMYLACNYNKAFFTDIPYSRYTMWTCEDVCESLNFLLNNIYVRFGQKIFRQVIGIPMGTNCAPLIADLFLYCYESDFMLKLSKGNNDNLIEAFNNTSRYLDDVLNLDNPYFADHIADIYPSELQLNKANNTDSEADYLDINIMITNGTAYTKIYDKRDDYNFDIVNFPHLDGDVPRATSYGVYISQLIRFARGCSDVSDFNKRNFLLTSRLLQQGYRFHKLRKTFSKFYYRNSDILLKYNTNLKTLLGGIAHPDYYGDLIYKLRKINNSYSFPILFIKIIKSFIKRGYQRNILQRTSCLVVDPFTVGHYAFLFNCAMTSGTLDSMNTST